ncbi:hypothetical protein TraAM80_03199 [Trypanosoma rangeli]|uniref:Sister chromatid cohesion protein n=1 Tax=Trypanosoma rangeli TaxID=5698 RepID=A0A3R7KJF0_TRYRA|nr:uncharacterized protein TraAM80_03199 [Trypanosoma rangeli]RNF07677.1 hypothetical protein TraAM80_03199 [Trypanosoma rangeli]|eukprot:RNF07677.1 hypothetical protein TraAM80_03199 [Trypanosoma rangeli]
MPSTATRRERSDGRNRPTGAAVTSKRARHEVPGANSDSVLSGSVLHNKADAQLLPWLFECHRVLRAANPPFSVSAAFIKELLNPRYLKSSLSGVQQMTGCLLSDLVRLGNKHEFPETSVTLPFDARYADDVLACLTFPFGQVARGEACLKTCEHFIERAGISHIFAYVIPHCRRAVHERLTCMFQSISQAAGSCTGSEALTKSDNAITPITAAEMGRVLADILSATKSITPDELAPLLAEITAASPTLLRRMESNRLAGNTAGGKPVANATRKKARAPGAIIAARVFLEQLDVIHPAIASYMVELVEQGVGEVAAAEVTGDELEKKRRGLRGVGRAMECFVALMELHVDLVGQLVPALLPYLEHEIADIRLLFLRGFFMAFGAHETATSTYRSAFAALLARFNDPKHALRIEMLQLAASAIGVSTQVSASFTEERVRDLLPLVELHLVDPHALVRRAAVLAYGDIVTAAPSLVTSERMEKTLGQRVADKNLKVRQAAVERLSDIYRTLLYPWIPNVMMQCLNAEGGVLLLEASFESMLPPASRVVTGDALLTAFASSTSTGRRSARASMALFDFEKESATQERSFADGLAKMCSHLNPKSFNKLLTFAAKKAQLRLAILRLFQLRAEVRSKDLKSTEGQEMINNIHRLLNFVQTMTHAEKGEWDALFRSKDDNVSKAFLSCCADRHLHYAKERELLVKALKGRVEGHVLKFVQESLSRQMMLPVELEHVNELIARLRETLRGVCGDGAETVETEVKHEVEGLLRALIILERTAPSFMPHCAVPLVDFVELVCQSSNAKIPTSWVILLLNCVTEWARYASGAAVDEHGYDKDTASADIINTRKKALFTSLARLCSCSHEPLLQDATPEMVGAMCKHAARCFIALISVNGLQESKALSQLVHSLLARIRNSATPTLPSAVGWLKALTAFAKDCAVAPLLQDESLMRTLTELLLAAVRDRTTAEDSAKVNAKRADVFPTSLAAAVVDATTKCMSAIALSYAADRVVGAVVSTLNALLAAYKTAGEWEPNTVGACRRRISINQQLAKLVIRPSSDIAKELAVAVILSAEDEVVVRRSLQKKITFHIMENQCDMRYVAFLILTVVSEETKSGYQYLRALLQQVGDHLRTKQRSSGATLSSPEALTCFLEYTIPFLVFFMAHHTFYSTEQENHFVAYQRVWHLLFDELFRHGTQCASFLVELFTRIKQSDEVVDRDSHAARLLCDLGSRVMQECLGQRQISADALKRYPGRVLLPNFFRVFQVCRGGTRYHLSGRKCPHFHARSIPCANGCCCCCFRWWHSRREGSFLSSCREIRGR